METAFWSGGTRVTRLSRAEAPSDEALVMFHGFPGQPPAAQVEKYRGVPRMRVEAAKAVNAELGMDAYLPGYEGLGESRGRFSFHRSVARSCELAAGLAARGYRKVHVSGHSWGAFVAFNAHRALQERAGRLALLAGLLDIPDEKTARDFLPEFFRDYPEIMGTDSGAFERAVADLERARKDFNPQTLAKRFPEERLLIVHSRPDAAVEVGISRRFHQKAGGRFLELDDDHGFSKDMRRVIDALVGFLKA